MGNRPNSRARSHGIPHREFRVGRKYRGQRISMDFKDADLTNVFRIIAEVSNINHHLGRRQGEGLLRLVNVPWDQALDIVLRSKSLGRPRRGTSSASRRFPPPEGGADRFDAQKQVEQSRQER